MMWAIYIGLIMAGLLLGGFRPYGANVRLGSRSIDLAFPYAVLVILFFGLLAWNNTDAADYQYIYLLPYQNPDAYTSREIGWTLLCKLGGLLGLSYNGFASIVSMLATYLFYRFAKGTGVNTSFFLGLFLIYPGLMSLVQFRQFFASSIVAVGLLLLCRKGKQWPVIYAVIVLLASLIHTSAIVMLPFALAPAFIGLSRRGKIVAVSACVVATVIIWLNALDLATLVFGRAKAEAYLLVVDSPGVGAASAQAGVKNVVFLIGLAALSLLCLWGVNGVSTQTSPSSAHHAMGKHAKLSKVRFGFLAGNFSSSSFFSAIALCNVSMLILLPFSILTNDFMRFERYAFTYALTLFVQRCSVPCRMLPELEGKTGALIHLLDFVLSSRLTYILVCMVFCYFYIIRGTFDTVFVPLLSLEAFPAFFG